MSYLELKAECYEANLLLPKYKLIDLTFGNVSVADHARGVPLYVDAQPGIVSLRNLLRGDHDGGAAQFPGQLLAASLSRLPARGDLRRRAKWRGRSEMS